jgi:uncharacterized protein YndB with AHSA1/START domain
VARIETSIIINRPVDEVFAAASNMDNLPKWSTATLEAEITSEGPPREGSTVRLVGTFLGRRIESDAQFTEFEPPHHFAMATTSGPVAFRNRWIFEPSDGGTKVTGVNEAETSGFLKMVRIAEPIAIRMGKRQLEADIANLKDLIEAGDIGA